MEKDYIDRALIKLKRKYGKDELVATLSKQLSEAQTENGKLKSYIDELKHNHKQSLKNQHGQLKKEIKRLEKRNKDKLLFSAKVKLKGNELYQNEKKQNEKRKKDLDSLRERLSDQTAKILSNNQNTKQALHNVKFIKDLIMTGQYIDRKDDVRTLLNRTEKLLQQ